MRKEKRKRKEIEKKNGRKQEKHVFGLTSVSMNQMM